MSEVLKLLTVKPNESIIKLLEDILIDAKNGDIVEFVGVALNRGGCVMSAYGGDRENVYKMLGAIEATKQEYMCRYIETGRTQVDSND